MVLARIVLRPDRRLAVGAAGLAMAILLPVAGVLALHAIEPRIDPSQPMLAYAPDGASIGPQGLDDAVAVLVAHDEGGVRFVAFTTGDPLVEPGVAWASRGAPQGPYELNGAILAPHGGAPAAADLVPGASVLVHPSHLESGGRVVSALVPVGSRVEGAVVVPARGADAFEAAGARDLQDATGVLVAVSLPATALVAAAFASHEVADRARLAATLTALGRPRLAYRLVVARALVMTGVGVAAAIVLCLALGALVPGFRPQPFPWGPFSFALAAPAVAGVLVAAWLARPLARPASDLLRRAPGDQDPPSRRLGWLPMTARPIALGVRALPALVLAALLFVVDVGFPLAVATVPAALYGGQGEWVSGFGSQGAVIPSDADTVLEVHEAIDEAVAETLVPTLVAGQPAFLRGGDWDSLRSYHRIRVVAGSAPTNESVALGRILAQRLDASVGDVVSVQASNHAATRWLEVSAIYAANPLLESEGLLTDATAGELAGVQTGRAALLRVRPDSEDAREAVTAAQPDIRITDLEVQDGTAGSLANVTVEAVNLGALPGSRSLAIRLDGQLATSFDIQVPGLSRVRENVSFIVPTGAFVLEVNPTSQGAGASSTLVLEVSDNVVASVPFTAHLESNGSPKADVRIGIFPSLEAISHDTPAHVAVTDGQGDAALVAPEPGQWFVAAGSDVVARILAGGADGLTVVDLAAWPSNPVPGQRVDVQARLANLGDTPEARWVDLVVGGTRFDQHHVDLAPGQETLLTSQFLFTGTSHVLRVDNATLELGSGGPGPGGQPALSRDPSRIPPPLSGGAVQAQVADRVLGNAQQVLAGLGAVAIASTMAVVLLSAERTLRGRSHALASLEAIGLPEPALRRRATLEAMAQATVAFVGALLIGKILFGSLARLGWPAPYGHALADPFTPLLAAQALVAFACAAGLAAFVATGPVLALRRRERRTAASLNPVTLPDLLEHP